MYIWTHAYTHGYMHVYIYIYTKCVFLGIASGCSIASGGPMFKKNFGFAPSVAPAGLAHCLRPRYFKKSTLVWRGAMSLLLDLRTFLKR